VPGALKEAAILTDYAVQTRYPGDWEAVGESDYKQAVLLADDVYNWVQSIIRS
jgi:HEPN domain-containing protein